MRFSSTASLSAIAGLVAVQAAPLGSRQDAGLSQIDITVLKLAVLAENLEATFYKEAAAKFTAQDFVAAGYADGQAVLDAINVIGGDEATHQTVLESVLTGAGQSASDVNTCSFGFDAGLADVQTFVATAQALELVGVAAYSGASILVESKTILLAAASILTVEARHSTNLNLLNLASPIPSAFDIALTPQSVLSVAAPFITGGCDPVAALGLTPNPALTVTNTGAHKSGDVLSFAGAGVDGKDLTTLFCHLITGGAAEAVTSAANDCKVPDVDGPVHVYITSSNTPYPVDIQAQATAELVAGPAQIIISKQENAQGRLLRGGGGGGGDANLAAICSTAASPAASSTISEISTTTAARATSVEVIAPTATPVHHAAAPPAYVQAPLPPSHEIQPPAHYPLFDISTIPSSHSGNRIVITETVVKDVRVKLGIKTPVHGSGGFVPLGWY